MSFVCCMGGEKLDQVVGVLRSRGLAVLMDTRTAEAARTPPDEAVALEELPARVNLAVVVGGDGTLLSCGRLMAAHGVPLIGVNLGRLGFLTDIPADKVSETLSAVLEGDFVTEERLMLAARVLRAGREFFATHAMNDVVVSRAGTSMIEFAVHVDGEFIYSLRADGIIRGHAHGLHRVRPFRGRAHPAPGALGGGARADLAAHPLQPPGGHPEHGAHWAQAYARAGLAYYPKQLSAVPFTPVAGPRLLTRPGPAQASQRALLADLLREHAARDGASGMHVNFTTPEDQSALEAAGFLRRHDCRFLWRNRGYRDFEDFLDGFRSDKRKKHRRERRRVSESGIVFRSLEGHSIDDSLWQVVLGFSERILPAARQ